MSGAGPDGGGPDDPTGPDAGYRALRDSAGVRVLGRDVLRVLGPDAATYLQGQASQDLEALAVGSSAESLLLSPQGKVEAYVRVSRTADDAFVIDTDAGFGEVVDARLRRFRLRVKAEIEVLPWVCVAVRGPRAAEAVAAGHGAVGTPGPVLVLPVTWPGFAGIDLLGPAPDGGAGSWVGPPAVPCAAEAWEAARIEAGVPVSGREIVEGTIAAEVGLVERTVSFTKGCFTGQELVARLDARGSRVARSLCAVVVGGGTVPTATSTSVAPPVGAEVWTSDGEHLAGALSSVAWSPDLLATVGLATLHRRVVPPEAVSVRWTGGDGVAHELGAEARPLPLVG